MSQIKYDVEINAPVERVYEYYTNPDNIKEAARNQRAFLLLQRMKKDLR
jgi:ligand-binding SRPBCC domain-containing protein